MRRCSATSLALRSKTLIRSAVSAGKSLGGRIKKPSEAFPEGIVIILLKAKWYDLLGWPLEEKHMMCFLYFGF
jgi:hypothetical protein